jgi:hypothetical protein
MDNMDSQNHNGRPTRRVILPSGKEIDVVVFDDVSSQSDEQTPSNESPTWADVLITLAAALIAFFVPPAAETACELEEPMHEVQDDTPATGLHICPECRLDGVVPIWWSEVSDTHWEMLLRCPHCEWSHQGVFDNQIVDPFDEELDRGTEALNEDLQRLDFANFKEEAFTRFLPALEAGATDWEQMLEQ